MKHLIRMGEPILKILPIREEADVTGIQVEIFRTHNRSRIFLNRDAEQRLRAPSFSKGAGRA